MSEILHLPESDCARVLGMLAQFVDGDLAAEQSAWLDEHVKACAQCRAALAGFQEIDSELIGWGKRLSLQNLAPAGAREQLAAKLVALPARRRARWMSAAAAAAIAAVLAIAMIVPHKMPTAVGRQVEAPFVEIPYLPPLDPHE